MDLSLLFQAHPAMRLLGALSPQEAALDDARKQWEERTATAQTEAESARTQFNTEFSAPEPEVSPLAESMTRLFGGLAQMLNPQGGGAEDADKLITKKQGQLREARGRRLATLEKLYMERAERAARLGDAAAQSKFLEAAERYSKTREQLFQLERDALDNETRARMQKDTDERRLAGDKELKGIEHENTLKEIYARGAEERKTVTERDAPKTDMRAKFMHQMHIDRAKSAASRVTKLEGIKKPDRLTKEALAGARRDLALARLQQDRFVRRLDAKGQYKPEDPARDWLLDNFDAYVSGGFIEYDDKENRFKIDAKRIAALRANLASDAGVLSEVGLTPEEALMHLVEFARTTLPQTPAQAPSTSVPQSGEGSTRTTPKGVGRIPARRTRVNLFGE